MSRAYMAALAEHRKLRDEHSIVVRTVRVVARITGLSYRGVVPQERTALFRMAADAHLVDPVADLQHSNVRRSVRVVARRAIHLRLAQRHVTRPLKLRDLGLVTRHTCVNHRLRLQLSPL